ncbi:MAG: hypothetical protein RL748_4505 [Pseudomonadota bacterium]
MNTQEPLKQEALDFLSFEHKRPSNQWPAGLFEKTAGAWQGEPLIRVAQEDASARLVLE